MKYLGGEYLRTWSLMVAGDGFGLCLRSWYIGSWGHYCSWTGILSWVPLGFLMPSGFQSLWIQPLISKVRDIVLIIIFTLEVLKGCQFWSNWKFFILSCMHSIKIFIKHQIQLRADVAVFRFLDRPTVLAYRGEAQKYWALLDLGIHLGNLFLYFSLGSRTYTGHPHIW